MKAPLLILLACLTFAPAGLFGQSLTTEALHKQHTEALAFFFYNNTLRMLNQTEDKEFDDLIRDIEKMRFLMIKKSNSNFGMSEYKRLVSDYKSEAFQEIMTSRHEGKTFDIFLKEKDGKTKGMLVLINDAENLYILDMLGRIALDKVTQLYSKLDDNTDISKRIRDFTGDNDDDKDDKKRTDDHH